MEDGKSTVTPEYLECTEEARAWFLEINGRLADARRRKEAWKAKQQAFAAMDDGENFENAKPK